MNKIFISLLLLATLLFGACSTEAQADVAAQVETPEGVDTQEVQDTISEVLEEAPQRNVEEIEDQVVHQDENITIEVEDNQVKAQINNTAIAQVETASFEEWCIPGETFSESTAEGEFEAEIVGVTTYQGNEVCEGEHSMTVESPMGDINVETTYYISEDISEVWVITNSMGTVTESYVELN